MPRVCGCGNDLGDDERSYVLVERPCRCEEPGANPRLVQGRAPPVDLKQPADPNRRRLGLPALSPIERAVLPPEQRNRYE